MLIVPSGPCAFLFSAILSPPCPVKPSAPGEAEIINASRSLGRTSRHCRLSQKPSRR